MSPNGMLYRTLATYGRLVAVNLGWLVVASTLVGAPPATAVLFVQLARLREERGSLGWRGYWRAFRAALGPSYALLALWGPPIAAVAVVCATSSQALLLGAAGLVLCCLVASSLHSGPALLSANDAVRTALRRAVRFPGRSTACLAIVVVWAALLLVCPWQLLLLPLSVAVSAPALAVLRVSAGPAPAA
ncbi:hypothetical protein [Asanoa sp. NPDC050611]|uniref:hypothetical protein n=1 Tax=Asanoa sp. NPDC050611 TaxID=3157098 RepID=UPI0033D69060